MIWDEKPHDAFEISVKALIFDEKGGLLFTKDELNRWDLPGGRIDKNEDVQNCLRREIMEELGVNAVNINPHPRFAELINFDDNRKRFLVGFEVTVDSFDFKPSGENVESAFVAKANFAQLNQTYKGISLVVDKIY